MAEGADVSPELIARLGSVCLDLPDAYEEDAWIGVRWRVRKKTFAHVFRAEQEWLAGFAPALAERGGEVSVLTFRSQDPERDVLLRSGLPFFKVSWSAETIGMLLEGELDWKEIEELLTESYCLRAPKKLVALVNRPAD